MPPKIYWNAFASLVALCLLLPFMPAVVAQSEHPAHTPWAYAGADGPEVWGKLDSTFVVCSTGHTQSPIDIKGAKAADLPPLNFDYRPVPLNIIDNGHTVQVTYAPPEQN